MTPTQHGLWIGAGLVGLIGSGLFSGLETGVYSLNRVRLHLLAHQRHRAARLLIALARRPETLLASLLIGTNLMNNLATSAIGVLLGAQGLSDLQIVVANVAIVTPLLFVFAETLPKDLFAAHADRWVYPFARPLHLAKGLFTVTGILPLVTGVSALMMRALNMTSAAGMYHPRSQVQTLVKEGVGRGLLSDDQSAIVQRVMALGDLTVGDEMQPWKRVKTVNADDPSGVLWDLAHQTSLSRFPVVDSDGRVVGVVSVYDLLLHERDTCPPVTDLMITPIELPADTPLREGLAALKRSHAALAIVVDADTTNPVGVVTMKDLIEPITGELVSW